MSESGWRHAVAQITTASLANLLLPLSAIVTGPLLARALGPADRGLYAALTSPVLLISVLGTLGLQDALTQYLANRQVDLHRAGRLLRKYAGPLIVLNAGLVALFTTFTVLGGASLYLSAAFLAITAPFATATSLVSGMAIGIERYSVVNANRVIIGGVRIAAVSILFGLSQISLVSALIVFTCSQAAAFAYLIVQLRRTADTLPSLGEGSELPSGVMRNSLSLLLGASFAVFLGRLDQSVALPIMGSASLGIYAVAVSVSEVANSVVNSIRMYILGSSGFEHGDRSKRRSVLLLSLGVGTIMGIVGASIVPWALPLLFGIEFESAVAPAIVMLLSVPFATVLTVGSGILIRMGRSGIQCVVFLIAVLANMSLLVVLAPIFGAMGLALASAAGVIAGSVATTLFILKRQRPALV